MQTYKNVLALSGGSVKGAFQAGVIAEVLKTFPPDAVYGATVGSLNGLFLLNESGKQTLEKGKPDWPDIGEKMANFWIDKITGPESIYRTRKLLGIAIGIFRKRFKGFVDTQPMRDLIFSSVKMEYIKASPLHFACAVMDVQTSDLIYIDRSAPQFLDYLVAAVTEPILMEPVSISDRHFVDSACRASSPLDEAIRQGGQNILSLNSHALKLSQAKVDAGDFVPVARRFSSTITWSQNLSDLRIAQLMAELVALGQGDNPKSLAYQSKVQSVKIIQPDELPNIEMQKFTTEDIKRLVELGKVFGRKSMNEI